MLVSSLVIPKACCATGPCDGPAVPLPSMGPHSSTLQDQGLACLSPAHFLGCISVSKAEIYNLRPEDIYLVHDDLDKALGKVAIKLGGSARYGVAPAAL